MWKLLIIFILVISRLVAIPVSAHSGRTDANGGHWDRSAGEYHYHHGYGPHDHYDMDRDGDEDCPYTFDSRVIGITNTSDAYDKGYSAGKSAGYDNGYDDGYQRGAKDARSEMSAEIDKIKKETRSETLLLSLFVIYPILTIVLESLPERKKNVTPKKETMPTNFNKRDPMVAAYISSIKAPSVKFIDYRDSVLIVIFDNGKEIHHFNVPKNVYDSLIASDKPFEFYMEHIKGEFPHY